MGSAATSHPEWLGKYRLVSHIAVGGMAEVFLGYSAGPAGFAKLVAIKRIHLHLADNPEFVEMFLDEARLASGLDHPNIVQIIDLGKADDHYFIAMEYIHGKTLRDVVNRSVELGRLLPLDAVLSVGLAVLSALNFAHNRRNSAGQSAPLIHRDVTPHNILISYSGNVKLVDFGIAKAEGRMHETQSGVVKGKAYYMAPEQMFDKEVDPRADLYSFGVVLHESLTGRQLFGRYAPAEMYSRSLRREVPAPSHVVPERPTILDAIVLKLLESDPDRRYQSCYEVIGALEEVMLSLRQVASTDRLAATVRGLFSGELQREERDLAQVTSQARKQGEWEPPPSAPRRASGEHGPPTAQGPARSGQRSRRASGEHDPPTVSQGPARRGPPSRRASSERELSAGSEGPTRSSPLSRRASSEHELSAGSEGPTQSSPLSRRASSEHELPGLLDDSMEEGSSTRRLTSKDLMEVGLATQAEAHADVVPLRSERDRRLLSLAPSRRIGQSRARRTGLILLGVVLLLGALLGLLISYPRPLSVTRSGRALDAVLPARAADGQAPAAEGGGPSARDRALLSADMTHVRWRQGHADLAVEPDAAPSMKHHPSPRKTARAGSLSLTSNPVCQVQLAGRSLGTTPLRSVRLPAGPWTLRLLNPSLHIDYPVRVVITAGQELVQQVSIGQGTLRVNAIPWARVILDGRMIDVTPIKPLRLYAGTHVVELVYPGKSGTRRYRQQITIRAKDVTTVLHDFLKDAP